jgi:hypothetical protein
MAHNEARAEGLVRMTPDPLHDIVTYTDDDHAEVHRVSPVHVEVKVDHPEGD